jgi:hypothetical protein
MQNGLRNQDQLADSMTFEQRHEFFAQVISQFDANVLERLAPTARQACIEGGSRRSGFLICCLDLHPPRRDSSGVKRNVDRVQGAICRHDERMRAVRAQHETDDGGSRIF